MEQTIEMYFSFVKALELNNVYENTIPFCEPQLGKRGLYPSSFNPIESRKLIHDRMHLLTYADGKNSLLEIADYKGISINDLEVHLKPLLEKGIIKLIN